LLKYIQQQLNKLKGGEIMGFLFDEKKLVNDSVFLHEQRMSSQYTRFLDKSPTYVTFYHINNIESITDTGFQSVERILGTNSPIRFDEVKDFPIYGIDQVLLSLSNDSSLLDTSYDGDGVILPNTIIPYPNDMFTISYLDQNYLFMVTDIAYDTIKSNNFYKISFTIRSLDAEFKADLLAQTVDKFSCIASNIGTEEKVLLRDDDLQQILAIDEVYTNITDHYRLLFFDDKYNSFLLTQLDGTRLYDRYMAEFINKFKILSKKKDFDTLYLSNEDTTKTMMLEYHNSIYRALELQKKEMIQLNKCGQVFITGRSSIFSFYRDQTIRSVQLDPNALNDYIRADLITKIQTPPDVLDETVIGSTIVKFFNDSVKTIYDLDGDSLKDYTAFMGYDQETFTLIPILLYILRFYYNKFMSSRT
jgi:hypothetical protein